MKCGGFLLSLPNKSDKEYGTSEPPSTLHYLRCRNPRYDDSHMGSTRNNLFLQTQRIQVPYESRTQRQRPTRHQQGSVVRKQNERTLILQYRIIPLFLHPIFHILAPLAPFPQDWGLSFPPKHFPANFFRNFFTKAKATFFCIFGAKNYGFLGRTFFYFFGAKNYEGRGHLSLRKWGGWSLFAGSPYSRTPFVLCAFICSLSSLPPGCSCLPSRMLLPAFPDAPGLP